MVKTLDFYSETAILKLHLTHTHEPKGETDEQQDPGTPQRNDRLAQKRKQATGMADPTKRRTQEIREPPQLEN